MKKVYILFFLVGFLTYPALADGHFNESKYSKMPLGQAIKAAYTSENLTNADLAWHAYNTYGWECEQVVSKSNPIKINGIELKDKRRISQIKGVYYVVACSSGIKLRVYPRYNWHPIITNINGGSD